MDIGGNEVAIRRCGVIAIGRRRDMAVPGMGLMVSRCSVVPKTGLEPARIEVCRKAG